MPEIRKGAVNSRKRETVEKEKKEKISRRVAIASVGVAVLSGIAVLLAKKFGTATSENNETQDGTQIDLDTNPLVEIKPDYAFDFSFYPKAEEPREIQVLIHNGSSRNVRVNTESFASLYSTIENLAKEITGDSRKDIAQINLNLTKEEDMAAGTEVVGSEASIELQSERLFLMFRQEGLDMVNGYLIGLLGDEFSNTVVYDQFRDSTSLGDLTDLTGLNATEREEVFSHGVRVALTSIEINRENFKNPDSLDTIYKSIYLPTLEQFLMNPAYFRDGRQTQRGFQMTEKQFAIFFELLKAKGSALEIEDDAASKWYFSGTL